MNALSSHKDLQNEFLALIESAACAHANDLHIRVAGDRAQVMATVRGEALPVAEWPLSRCEDLLSAAFALCDKADDYVYGSARSMRMTGERAALPEGVTMALVQFMPAKDGGRHLVARLSYAGDVCCGTCGGS